jgi:single-stranded-DNA-specific exonuclease
MISVSGKTWTQQKVNINLVEKVKQDYGFSDILSQLIISRNYDLSEIYGIKNKPKIGSPIKAICFNCLNKDIGEHLLNNKNNINIIGQIYENF